ncbi:MAG: hypothetical protein E6J17_02615 [Chloroflexi bacterium]|nr:MAG: hypothetical protein E6J17_02615 [Chloroflexota bacterium]
MRPGGRDRRGQDGPAAVVGGAGLASPARRDRRAGTLARTRPWRGRRRIVIGVVTERAPTVRTTAGPGGGPGGAPLAIALSPILAARYRARDLERIREAAPGARLITLSVEGLADGPLDDVEVLLRGWLSAEAFDRLLARAPRLSWVHSASAGVERALTPTARERGVVITNARGVFSRPIAEYVLMMILAISRRLPQLLELQRERTWQPLEGHELRDLTILGSSGSVRSGGPSPRSLRRSAAGWSRSAGEPKPAARAAALTSTGFVQSSPTKSWGRMVSRRCSHSRISSCWRRR